uniref:lamin tail domain-containing protein 2 n=1 Tax=Euleptes europaea TaxID=460621 RepID=UPI0025412EBF|nr:lamin tail domain-containing protein 2 [Euleptes europaea]
MEDLPATEKKNSVLPNNGTIREVEMEHIIPEGPPVVTKVSLLRSEEDFKKRDSVSTASHTSIELTKQETEDLNYPQQSSQPTTNPRVLLLLLHQKDLEIKGLKNAVQGHPPDRLACILQELVRTRHKGPLKKSQTEDILRREIEQLNAELKDVKESHMKEVQTLQERIMRLELGSLSLQDEVKIISPKSVNESDTESNMSLDEGAQLACESFELWSETGNRLLPDKSDLRLRRIPKHTSFVDAFHKLCNHIFSDEDKDEKVITDSGEEKELRHLIPVQSSQESSQKSDFVSTVTDSRTTESSSSLPSLMEKLGERGSVNPVDYWSILQSSVGFGEHSAGKAPWMPFPFKENHRGGSSGAELNAGFGSANPSFQLYTATSEVHVDFSGRWHRTECCARPASKDFINTSSLKIVGVHYKGKFIRILNTSLNKEVDLSGCIIQQWVGGYPVSVYRFPNGTDLPAQHHITVWAAGANLAQKQPSETSLGSQRFFRTGPECTTILCNRNGQNVSQYTAPHRFTAAAEAYSDNVDLSVDKFQLTDDKEDSLVSSWPSREDASQTPKRERMDSYSRVLKTRYTDRISIESSGSIVWNLHPRTTKKRISVGSSPSSILSVKSGSYPLLIKDSHSSSSDDEYYTSQTWKPSLEEPKVREFKTTLDTTLPMVALIGQKSARSKYGFKYMNYVPTSTDLHLRRYYYGS